MDKAVVLSVNENATEMLQNLHALKQRTKLARNESNQGEDLLFKLTNHLYHPLRDFERPKPIVQEAQKAVFQPL